MDSPQPLSDSAKLALQTITGEVIKPATTPQEIKAMKLNDYKALCTEMLPDLNAALSDEVLNETLEYIAQDPHLKRNFAPGFTYCPVAIPCGTYGAPLDDEEIKDGVHMRTLMINGQGQTVSGFSQKTTHLFNVFPKEVQANAFTIPGYENPDQYTITDNDRAMVAKLYTDSFRALKKLISNNFMKEPETTTGWGDDPDKPYEEVCKERAGTTLFWLVEDVPVREQYSIDGKTSQRFGLKEGQWVLGYPGESTFFENASRVEQADFDAAVNKLAN